jgi:hypothetical protein
MKKYFANIAYGVEICILLNVISFEYTLKININIMPMQDPHLSNVMLITCIMLVSIPLSAHTTVILVSHLGHGVR